MNENKIMDINDFYTIETPPSSSSTSKDSTEDILSSFYLKNKFKSSKPNIEQISSNTIICSTSKSSLTKNPINIKDHQVILFCYTSYSLLNINIFLSLLKQNIFSLSHSKNRIDTCIRNFNLT